MPRPHRSQIAGATYHITTHGVANTAIFTGDEDCDRFLAELGKVVESCRWSCLAVSLLDTHYHLLVTIENENLDRGMQRLNGSYAGFFNRTHGRKGHLFGERFYNGPVVDEAHFLLTVRYIARNATDAGLAADPASDKRSSYPGVIGVKRCWPFVDRKKLLAHFGSGEQAVRRLRDFVEGD